MVKNIANIITRIIALFYAYGAIVHILNMLSLTGFNWLGAPFKWQILDIVYLLLDAIVAGGLFFYWRLSIWCFYIAAISQIFLYTIFRSWILDVPIEIAPSAEQVGYLTSLVIFHIVTILLMTLSLYIVYNNSFNQDENKLAP